MPFARDSAPWRRPWRQWYQLQHWRDIRRAQLRREPRCAICLNRGVVTPASIVHHEPHHYGDWNKFISGPLQSLCQSCHEAKHGRMGELTGTPPKTRHSHRIQHVDEDGWPIDDNDDMGA